MTPKGKIIKFEKNIDKIENLRKLWTIYDSGERLAHFISNPEAVLNIVNKKVL